MFHIVYGSSAAYEFAKPELHVLLEQARAKNMSLGITGMLLYKDGNFMQVLEGDREVVLKLASTIEKDPRHRSVLFLIRGTSDQRLFPKWSMGFRNLADADAVKTPGYNDFMNTSLTSAEFSQDPNRCMKLLSIFKQTM